ncbi:hypothetical protein VNO78_02058 [Psophocarpus tetragonolobus]|uniref:VQ domain-containing protein n=1 Tax=Psophocarpus tetragonolobus TaxID=3891 RepID=A0AAN9T297_PSOTE
MGLESTTPGVQSQQISIYVFSPETKLISVPNCVWFLFCWVIFEIVLHLTSPPSLYASPHRIILSLPMNPPPKREVQLQGPRPPPLKVSKESHKIKKPPPHPHHHHPHAPPDQNPQQQQQQREPVIIYSVSPKVIHVTPGDFMDVVQRLTGSSAGEDPLAGRGDVSPAARLASIEKTSPSEREREKILHDDVMWMLEEGVQVGQFPGILSPEPGTLPPIPSEVFSPASEAQTASSYWNDFSPSNWSASSFLASPSGFLSVALASPQPSPNLFSLFDS